MHILVLKEYYPPDTSATAKMAALVAETLAKKHQVTVLAGRPSYDPDEYYPFAFLRSDKSNNVTVERVGSTDFPRHEMKRRVSNYLSYLALAVPRALAIRPDVVLAMTDPPVARWEEMHRRALREAARVIVLGDDMRERILAKGVAPDRVAIVRDGASPSGPLRAGTHPAGEEVRA